MVITFKNFLREMNVSGAGGVFGVGSSGEFGGSVGNSDFYAPGDTRVPQVLGAYSRKGKLKSRKKRKKK